MNSQVWDVALYRLLRSYWCLCLYGKAVQVLDTDGTNIRILRNLGKYLDLKNRRLEPPALRTTHNALYLLTC